MHFNMIRYDNFITFRGFLKKSLKKSINKNLFISKKYKIRYPFKRFIPYEDTLIQIKAFKTLSTFKLEYFSKDNVPISIQNTVESPVRYNEQLEREEINQAMFVSLQSLDGVEYFWKKIIEYEIVALPRNTAHNAIKKFRRMRQNVEIKGRIDKITTLIRVHLSQV